MDAAHQGSLERAPGLGRTHTIGELVTAGGHAQLQDFNRINTVLRLPDVRGGSVALDKLFGFVRQAMDVSCQERAKRQALNPLLPRTGPLPTESLRDCLVHRHRQVVSCSGHQCWIIWRHHQLDGGVWFIGADRDAE